MSKNKATFTHEQAKARAARASSLLNDDILSEAFESAREDFIRTSLEARELSDREAARNMVFALVEVRRQLERIVSDGEYAATALRRAK